ncbi:MAG: hypothetical protein WCV67_07595 [Victivallaceae bacterium]|jgi:hypothetical protein
MKTGKSEDENKTHCAQRHSKVSGIGQERRQESGDRSQNENREIRGQKAQRHSKVSGIGRLSKTNRNGFLCASVSLWLGIVQNDEEREKQEK